MQPLKLDQFLEYKFLSNIRYSPDGKRAAFVVSRCDAEENGYCANLYLYDERGIRRLSGMDKESAFFWEDDMHVLFAANRSADEKKRAEAGEAFTAYYRLAVDGGEAEKAFELPIGAGELMKMGEGKYWFIVSVDPDSPDDYLLSKEEKEKKRAEKKKDADYVVLEEHPFWMNGGSFRDKSRDALFTFDAKAGEIRRVTDGDMDVEDAEYINGKFYYWGERFADRRGYRPGLFVIDGERETCLIPQGEKYFSGMLKYDGGLAIMMSDGKTYSYEETPNVHFLNPETDAIRLLSENHDNFYNSVGSDCRRGGGYNMRACGKNIYTISTVGGAAQLRRIDECGESTFVYAGDGCIDAFDVNERGEILAIAMMDGKLQELYRVNPDGAYCQISEFNEAVLKDRYVSDYEEITVHSEGEDVTGWVLKPIDYDPEKTYPAILDIHGGPRTVYGKVFYHEMQYWAGQGYFVFFANPIGSDGRGDAFADIRGKYGVHEYQNLMDFTDAVLEKHPEIDKKRVAVTGGSYGGFMTNWIIGHTDRFCCAATQRSISNWVSFYGTSDIGILFGEYQTDATVFDNPEKMWQQSPLKYAKNFVTPTLIIHSDCDYRCPISEGFQLYTALKERGVDSRMVIFKGENHDLSRTGKPLHRVRRLTEISDWFAKYAK